MKNIDRAIEKIIKLILPLIFFLPLVVNSGFYFPFVTPRNFLFRIIVSMLLALYIFLLVRNPSKYRPPKSKILFAYLFLAFILTLSSLIAGNFYHSFWSTYERMDGLINLYYLLALFVIILALYYRQKAWLFLLRATVMVSFIVSYVALCQHFGLGIFIGFDDTRSSAFFGNAAYLASYSLIHLFLALYLMSIKKIARLKFETIIFYILDLLIIFSWLKHILGGDSNLYLILGDFILALFFIVPQILLHLNLYLKSKKEETKILSGRYFFLIVALANFLAVYYSVIRGAFLGLAISLAAGLLFLLFSRHSKKVYKKYIAAALLAGLIVISSVFIFRDSALVQSSELLRRVSQISLRDTTVESRLLTWQASVSGFLEKPILGWGEENYYQVFDKYFPTAIFKSADSRVWFDRPHNIFIQHLIQGGILGLIAFLSIFFFAFKNLFLYLKKTKNIKTFIILFSLLVAYLVQDFFVFDSINSYPPLILLLSMIVFIDKDDFTYLQKSHSRESRRLLAAFLCFIFLLSVGYYFNIPRAYANRDMIASFKKMQNQDSFNFDRARHQQFLSLLDQNYLGRDESRQLYSEYTETLIANDYLSKADILWAVARAEDGLLDSLRHDPNNVRAASFLINLYVKAGQLDSVYYQKAIDLAKNTIKYSPNRTRLYYYLGAAYTNLADYEQAEEVLEQAKRMSPNIIESYFYIFVLRLKQEDFAAIDDLMADFRQEMPEYLETEHSPEVIDEIMAHDLERFADTYIAFGYIPEALELYEEITDEYGANKEIVAKISLYYNRVGNKKKSSEYLSQLRAIDPIYADSFEAAYLKEF